MPEHIESKSFREAARNNCVRLAGYPGIPIYTKSIPSMTEMHLASYKASDTNGAVSQLFSALANIRTQIEEVRKGIKMGDAKDVPGVSYGEIEGTSLNLSGDVYFASYEDYARYEKTVAKMGSSYGWGVTTDPVTQFRVYKPIQSGVYNQDPVQAAIKGMVIGQISREMDMASILATNQETAGTAAQNEFIEARARYDSMNPFRTMEIQYLSNKPSAIQGQWALVPKVELMIDGVVVQETNIGYVPTSFTSTPGAFVVDSSGKAYPTKCSVSMQLQNPLGGLLANFVNAGKADTNTPARVTAIGNLLQSSGATSGSPTPSSSPAPRRRRRTPASHR